MVLPLQVSAYSCCQLLINGLYTTERDRHSLHILLPLNNKANTYPLRGNWFNVLILACCFSVETGINILGMCKVNQACPRGLEKGGSDMFSIV